MESSCGTLREIEYCQKISKTTGRIPAVFDFDAIGKGIGCSEEDRAPDSLLELSRRYWALRAEENSAYDDLRARMASILPDCKLPSVAGFKALHYHDSQIDEEIDERLENLPGHAEELEHLRAWAKSRLAEAKAAYAARAMEAGIPVLKARLAAIEEEWKKIEDQMQASPIRTAADIAVLLDMAIVNDLDLNSDVPTAFAFPFLLTLVRRLGEVANETIEPRFLSTCHPSHMAVARAWFGIAEWPGDSMAASDGEPLSDP